MDSWADKSLLQKEAEEEEETRQMERHIALLSIQEKFAKKEAALLAGEYSTAMWEQAEEESGKRCEMQRQAEEDMMKNISSLPPERWGKAMKHYYSMKYEAAEWKALVAKAEKWKALLASKEKSARREKAKAKAKAMAKTKAKAKAKANEEAGRPEEYVTETMKAEEVVAKEDYIPKGVQRALLEIKERWAKKKNNTPDETLRKLVKDFSDNFDISMRSTLDIQEHTPMVESDKLLLQPADPSATNSRARLGVQGDHYDRGKSSATKEMAYEAKNFDKYRRYWESAWGKTRSSFEQMTSLSSMQFTYYTPGKNKYNGAASTPATLQIFSIKLAEVAGGLKWPLSVYGVVAVRDVVDHNRNFLFSCERNNSQELTQNDPFLRLIGPSRAVVYTDEVNFEIQLKVKGTTESEDKALITEARNYEESFDETSSICFKNCFCTIEFHVQVVESTTQATILGVQVARGATFPFKYGARVACTPVPGEWVVTDDNRVVCVTRPASGEVVMVDSKDGAMLKGCDGYLHLPRNVVSVETQGRLDIDIQVYSKSGKIAAHDRASFQAKFSKISQKQCFLCGVELVITVAWSRVVKEKGEFMALGRSYGEA